MDNLHLIVFTGHVMYIIYTCTKYIRYTNTGTHVHVLYFALAHQRYRKAVPLMLAIPYRCNKLLRVQEGVLYAKYSTWAGS